MDVNAFKHSKITKSFLLANHFRYSRGWSEDNLAAYITTFPIYKYHGVPTLELRIVVYEDGTTRLDVLDSSTRGVYSPWYRNENYDKYPILKEIDQNINKIMTSMGFINNHTKENKNESKSNPYRSRQHGAGIKPSQSSRK